jgi:hypothetical protein
LVLYPQEAVERVKRARILLAKALQLILGFGLGEREVRYLLTHAPDFDDLDLSKLPTSEADDSPAGATALVQPFLRLANYARLKGELAPGTDDLIGIFEAEDLDDAHKRIASLTRREPKTVQATANALSLNATAFTNERGLQRLWEGLQLVEKLGVPTEAVSHWTNIVKLSNTPDEEKERVKIARDLKDTVKSRYEPENWQRIAQPIFDKLRPRQRDALVAYILHRHGFDRMEQLFEYFLIDPGMEPIVQTSRIRLAISSVQLFIQRCLLNLEPKVHPSVINSKHWEWMKRYRVWEANRKIFLFPENWLEPEFRDDKTHLFQELESALLQGDVSNDLVEDAFFNYLKQLKELAQLDIVAIYCEEKPDPALNTLHVIGRTSPTPHKYFYRRYANQMWTPWEPVTAEIDGDHIVAVVWRERLHLFWITFLPKPLQDSNGPTQVSEDASVGKIFNITVQATPQMEVQVQLNWSEYFQGQWTTCASSGFRDPIRVPGGAAFNSRGVFVHVAKEYDERSLKIELYNAINAYFKVVSKNNPPELKYYDYAIDEYLAYVRSIPYSTSRFEVNRLTGSGGLKVAFVYQITTEDGQAPTRAETVLDIFRQGELFSILRCGHLFDPLINEHKALLSPFFYQSAEHLFFVEPTLTETTIDR